jgi:catechol 2,3-dioxygenase-like lactoylglutathione lyase family enzyme
MKRIILVIGVAVGVISMLVSFSAKSQTPSKVMKMNAGIVTRQLKESKTFYERVLNFGVTFENDFYVLMHTPNHSSEISFLLPEHPTQQPLFHKAFARAGMYLTIEVPDVDSEYKRIKALGVPIMIDIRNEEWGDRHFAIVDPNGVGIDIVTYAPSK